MKLDVDGSAGWMSAAFHKRPAARWISRLLPSYGRESRDKASPRMNLVRQNSFAGARFVVCQQRPDGSNMSDKTTYVCQDSIRPFRCRIHTLNTSAFSSHSPVPANRLLNMS